MGGEIAPILCGGSLLCVNVFVCLLKQSNFILAITFITKGSPWRGVIIVCKYFCFLLNESNFFGPLYSSQTAIFRFVIQQIVDSHNYNNKIFTIITNNDY